MLHIKKGIFLLIIGMLAWLIAPAQQELRMRIENQYEDPLKEFNLETSTGSQIFKADKEGYAIVDINPDEQVKFSANNYESINFTYNKLPQNKVLVVKKEFSWKDLLNPMFYIIYGGLWMLLLIVFAETGLFAGFFLPGDSLLFVAGIYSTNLAHEFWKILGLQPANEFLDLVLLIGLITLAGVIGNTVGFWFGRKIGPAMFKWKDNLFFKKHYLEQAHDFYDKHGGGAIVFARFLPIVRTFAPIIAGIVGMDKKKFAFFNIVGCISWVVSMVLGGHFLQLWVKKQFGFELKEHLEVIVIVIIAITTAPVIWKMITGSKKKISRAESPVE